MQDNASGYSAKAIIQALEAIGIKPIFWPSKSPDLNPIETLWNKIKEYIHEHYPQIHRSYPRLREAVIEAWESIPNEEVLELIALMPKRYRAVIEAGGWHTKY